MSNYTFPDPPDTACFACDHIVSGQRPILLAAHEAEEGYWQFLCGQTDHNTASIKIITLKKATEIDKSINLLAEMPKGMGADRESEESEWQMFSLES